MTDPAPPGPAPAPETSHLPTPAPSVTLTSDAGATNTQVVTTQKEGDQPADLDLWTPPVVASTAIAVAALLAAAASAYYAYRSMRIAKAQEDRNAAKINSELLKSATWESRKTESMWVGALLSVEHPSDRDGSISRAELVIKYPSTDYKNPELRIKHEPSSRDGSGNYITMPAQLPANCALEGWFTFPVPMPFFSREILEMRIELRDTRGFTAVQDIGILTEVADDPTQAG